MNALDLFNKVYVINLDQHPFRLQKVTERLTKLNITFTRLKGCTVEGTAYEGRCENRPGLAGNALSHLAAITEAWETGLENVLIFEDDAILADDLNDWIPPLSEQLSRCEWGLFFMGLKIEVDGMRLDRNLWQVKDSYHTHAFAVHRRAMRQCIQWLQKRITIDFFDSFRIDVLKTYSRPLLAVQESHPPNGYADRLNEYASTFNIGRFIHRCKELQGRTYKNSFWKPSGDTSQANQVVEGLLNFSYVYDRIGFDRRVMSFNYDGTVGKGAAGCEIFWNIRTNETEVWLDLYSVIGLTCSMKLCNDYVWRGQWEICEKMDVQLTRE